MADLGFDFDHGRLDESLHPFCGGVPDDVRMTARYDETDVATGLMAVLHETGHALYNAGLPKAWRGQPVGAPRSAWSVHESQSLLLEMQVCRSRAFLGYLAPLLERDLRARGDGVRRPTICYRAAIRVARSLIRVDADEVTYPCTSCCAIASSRRCWRRPAGRRPARRLERGHARAARRQPAGRPRGLLQDIHWPTGAFGYFPCYTLGALMAAQLFEALRAAVPELAGPDRARGVRAAGRLAAGQRPPAGLAARHPDPAGPG